MASDLILQAIAKLDPAVLFKNGVDGILTQIETEARARAKSVDETTPEGRDFLKSVAFKVAQAKGRLDDTGKEFVASLKKEAGAVDEQRRKIRDSLDALRDEIKRPATDWEAAEQRRLQGHEDRLRTLAGFCEWPLGSEPSLKAVEARIEALGTFQATAIDWQEYTERAQTIAVACRETLIRLQCAAQKREADAAELEALRQEVASAKAEKERQAQAEAAAVAAKEREERNAFLTMHASATAENMARDAAARAVIEERNRVEAAAAALKAAETKREENKRHRAKVHNAVLQAIMLAFRASQERNDHDLAKAVVEALVRGDIPNVKINY